MRRIILALVAAMAALGQSSQPLQKPSISGRVLRQNGDVALRVIVSLVGPERYTVTSDAHGVFSFGGVAPGRYSLIAQRAGYSAVKYGGPAPLSVNCVGIDLSSWSHAMGGDDAITQFRDCIERAPGVELTVTPGLELKDLTLRIAETGVIRGTVTNPDAEGMPGTMTVLVRDRGARTLRTVATASIGQDGNYTVDDLPPGRYYLLARSAAAQVLAMANLNGTPVLMATNQVPAAGEASEAEVATYYPSETSDVKAVPVEVKAGDELRGLNVMMRRALTFSVRGAVVMPAGSPQGSMALTMTPKGAQNNVASNRAVAGPGGSFEFRAVSPGMYVISGRTQALFGRQEVSVAASDVEGVRVTMSPATGLSGMVKIDGPAPSVWPSVKLASDDGSFSNTLKPGPDGKFTTPAMMPPVDYAIELSAMPPGLYVKSMRFGSQDVLRGKLDLGAASSGVLEIVLSPNAAVLAGKVIDAAGGSMHGVQVTAWPRNAERGGRVHLANIDQDGNFSMADLAPGDYWVAAWEALPAALSGDPGFLGRFQSSAVAVRLEEGVRTKTELKVILREKSDAEASRLL